MKGTSSYQRSSKWYRDRGFTVVKVETFSRGIKHDLMGIIDALALSSGQLIAVQACGGSDHAAHMRTLTEQRRTATVRWLATGNDLHLIGWRKIGRPARWRPRLTLFALDFMGELVWEEVDPDKY